MGMVLRLVQDIDGHDKVVAAISQCHALTSVSTQRLSNHQLHIIFPAAITRPAVDMEAAEMQRCWDMQQHVSGENTRKKL